MDIRNFGDGFHGFAPKHRHAGHHLVIPAGKQLQHLHRFFFRMGLAQDLALADHDSVRSNDHIFSFPFHRQGLQPAHPGHLLAGRFGFVHLFIDIRHPYDKGSAEKSHQLPSAGGLGCQNYFHKNIPFTFTQHNPVENDTTHKYPSLRTSDRCHWCGNPHLLEQYHFAQFFPG